MKKRLILLVLLTLSAFMIVVIGMAQTRDEFKQKYGAPDVKGRYIVRPDIGLSIEYKQGQSPFEMVIKPHDSDTKDTSEPDKENSPKVMPSDEAEEVLDELVPVSKRGEKISAANTSHGCPFSNYTEYERLTILITKRCERRGGGTYSINVRWKE